MLVSTALGVLQSLSSPAVERVPEVAAVRAAAARRLATVAPTEPALLSLLDDEAPPVRLAAVQATAKAANRAEAPERARGQGAPHF